MIDFSGKKILLIMPNFFGYEREIVNKLNQRGASIAFYGDRPSLATSTKVLIRIHPNLVRSAADAYFRKIIEAHGKDDFDYILIIKGESMSMEITKEIFEKFSTSKKIFYLWDSFKNSKGAFSKIDLFDSVLTFDPLDAENTPNTKFRPLFYSDSYSNRPPQSGKPEIDILFVGTAHTDRYKVLTKLEKALPNGMRAYYYFFLASRLIFWSRRIFDPRLKGAKYRDFHFKPLSAAENASLFQRAWGIADVERKVQKGLTMRTLEVLAAGKKLITTNAEVRKYDFFDENNILVIDRETPVVPISFLNTPFRPIDSKILMKYSIDTWLDEVFS